MAEEVEAACWFEIHPGRRWVDPEPPEYCEEPAVPGEDFCPAHLEV